MRLLIRKIVSSFAFYIFIALILFNFPKAIYQSAEFERRAIISSFGIDRIDNEYEVSGLVLAESSPREISSNTQLVSAKGRDVSEALYMMSVNLGKEIGFAHCDTFVLSDSLKNDDIAKVLDFCIRGSTLSQNSKILTCKGSAKEVLKVNMEKKDQIGISLARSITNSSDYLSITDMDLKEFYNRYYSKSGVAWMNVVEVDDDPSQQASQDGGDSNSGKTEGKSSQQQAKIIKSEGKVAIYKKGKLQFIAEGEFANFINILNPYTKMGYLMLENIEEEDKVVEKMSLQIMEKKTKRKFYFKDSQAVCDMTIKLYLNVLSMKTNDIDVYEIDETETHITKNVKNAINEYMQKYNQQLIELCDQYQTDVYRLNTRLFQMKNKEYKKFVSIEEQNNGYINNSKINLKVEIESKL